VREHEGAVYAGDDHGSVTVNATGTGAAAHSFRAHSQPVLCMCASEQLLYTGSRDASIRVWDLRTFKCLRKLRVHSGAVTALQLADGTLWSASWDGSIFSIPAGGGAQGVRRAMAPAADCPAVCSMQARAARATPAARHIAPPPEHHRPLPAPLPLLRPHATRDNPRLAATTRNT